MKITHNNYMLIKLSNHFLSLYKIIKSFSFLVYNSSPLTIYMMQSGKMTLKSHKITFSVFCVVVLGIFNATFSKNSGWLIPEIQAVEGFVKQ